VPAGVLAASPALWRGPKIRAVPGLDFFAGRRFSVEITSILADRLSAPPRFPDLLAPM